jgi:hypothetical protein
MFRKTAIALVLGAAAIGAGTAASGQYRDDYDRDYRSGWGGNLPPGNWDRTCTNARMNGPVLRARCDNGSGRWIYTELDVRRCGSGGVRNTWGQLTCSGNSWGGNGRGYGWGGGLPRGNWDQTCRNARMNGPVLSALCDDGNGRWRGTSIDVRQCGGDRIRNSWGRLSCD